jgi:type II secretory pathway pseudopilin PulG
MRLLNNRSGFSMIEVLVVAGVMTLIGFGAVSIMLGAVSCFDNTTTEAFTDSDAVLAMQRIVSDVREAKSVTILDEAGNPATLGPTLSVGFPIKTEDGYYDRHTQDAAGQIDYYLSDATANPDHTGTWLWRVKTDGTSEMLKKDISELLFEQDTSRSVRITIVAQNQSASGPRQAQLTQRVVYLRNY